MDTGGEAQRQFPAEQPQEKALFSGHLLWQFDFAPSPLPCSGG